MATGLTNKPGQNNCFLNRVVQVLYHLKPFRHSFNQLTAHACSIPYCNFCALKMLFIELEYGDGKVIEPLSLRLCLAQTFKNENRFQLNDTSDACECMEAVLSVLHGHLCYCHPEDVCEFAHCLTHKLFSMNIHEQVQCSCGIESQIKDYRQLVFRVVMHSFQYQTSVDATRSFGHRLRLAVSNGELVRPCREGCGLEQKTMSVLTNKPSVVIIGLTWDSAAPDVKHIRGFVSSISL